jgi:arylsulfatase A-like enzyme
MGAALFASTEETAGPGDAALWEYVDLGSSEGGVCRAAVEGYSGDGFTVAPGFPALVPCSLPGPSVLLFRSCTQGMASAGPLTLEILLDEELVHRESLEVSPRAGDQRHRIELPAAGGTRLLTFRVAGGAALTAILAPAIAPLPGHPTSGAGPDLALFIADTFRADNAGVYGGEDFLTPNLGRFAAEGLVFTRALAPASWTLPSHAALFTGLYPHESGVRSPRNALAEEAVTLAEALQAAGYRTGAITDDAFVSPDFGLAQGFEYFHARRRQPVETLEAVTDFLEADDGRPTFLVVHTYRSHHPYVVTETTRAALAERIGLRAGLDPRDYEGIPQSIRGWTPDHVPASEARQRMADYEALYRGASADLDALFGDVLRVLRTGSRTPVIVFTSDHGEAFWEHGIAEHGNGVWNEHLEIPLILAGPGIGPGESAVPASLIDLPRTLAGLAGIDPHPVWGGVDLLRAPDERALLAFQCDLHGRDSSFALFARGKKLVFAEDPAANAPALQAAFDLDADPEERLDRAAEPWAADMARAYAPHVLQALQAKLGAAQAVPGEAALEDMGHLGYGGR